LNDGTGHEVARHLESIAESLASIAESLRVKFNMPQAERSAAMFADPGRLQRCQDVNPARCAIADDDARRDIRTFGNPNAWECLGCGHMGSTADAEAGE